MINTAENSKYSILKNKRGAEKLEVFEISIVCFEDFKPTENEFCNILKEANLVSELNDVLKLEGGKLKISNFNQNYFKTFTKENFSKIKPYLVNSEVKPAVKKEVLVIKTGNTVILNDNTIGRIVKYPSNSNIILAIEGKENRVINKSEIKSIL